MANLGSSGFGGKGVVASGAPLGGNSGITTPVGGYTPVLDTLDATSQFAWGVYQLSSSESNCVSLRESGGDTLENIGFDGNGLLNTVAADAHIGVNDGFARVLYDANDVRDATETTKSLQIQYTASGVLSRPCFFVSGSRVSGSHTLGSAITGTTPVTIFILLVASSTRINGSGEVMYFDTADSRGYYSTLANATPETFMGMSQGAGNDRQDTNLLYTENNSYLIEVRRDAGGNTEYYINNDLKASSSFANDTDVVGLIGRTLDSVSDYELYETVYFNTDISALDKTKYIAHIESNYGLSF